MRKSHLINCLLGCSILVVQGSGLHVHAHQHVGAHDSPEPVIVHLALATDHSGDQGKRHDQDAEISISDNGIIKKAGLDKDPLGHAQSNLLVQFQFIDARQVGVRADPAFPYRALRFTRPLLRAPPTIHSF